MTRVVIDDRARSSASVRRPLSAALFALTLAAACSSDVTGPTQVPSGDESQSAKKSPPAQPAPTPAPPPAPVAPTSVNALAGATFYVDPYSSAKQTADAWRTTRPADATQISKIASQPQARWMGNWNADIYGAVSSATTTMAASGALPIFVAYNIPQRDCGGYSGANSVTPAAYRTWIAAFAQGIGSRQAVVVLEPDALAGMDCLNATDQAMRLDLLRFAIQTLTAQGGTRVYLDAGHARWHSASTMAARLTNAGVASAAGFSLNVSNFYTNAENVTYGQQVSALIGGKHFIIDSGRNGLGATADGQWCNPAGRALGTRPTTNTGITGLDAFLWIKTPGESDGACNGAPAAGVWMPEYALGLAQRAAF